MSWQPIGQDMSLVWVEDGQGDPNNQSVGGNTAGNTNTGNTGGGNTVATNTGRWHPDMPIPNWPQYPSGDLAPYNLGYANLADQILGASRLPDSLSSSPFYGQGAGRYAYAQGMGNGTAFPKNAGRSAPWLGNGLFPSFAGQSTQSTPAGGLLGSSGNSQPVPPVTTNGKPPTKVDSGGTGLLGNPPPTSNGGAGNAINANYIPGVNLPWGQVPSVGDPVNQYGAPTGRDLGHLWGQTYQEDAGNYTPVTTNMSYARYAQYMQDLANGVTRDETTGGAYVNGQPYKASNG